MNKAENNRDSEDGGVDKVDTVPPPPGEDDAYSAPTKMHLAPPEAVLSAMKEATRLGLPLKPQALPKADEALEIESGPAVLTDAADVAELSIANVIEHVNRKQVAIPLNILVALGCVVVILLTMTTLLLFVVD